MSSTATLATTFRPLTDDEIRTMESAGCSAEAWESIEVAERFNAAALANVTFSGEIRLGTFNAMIPLPGGIERPSGIRNAALHNCRVGHNVLIRNIGRHIANFSIGDDVVIENVDLLAVEGETTFGNGVRVRILNEAGGRETPIFDRLSAQIAYFMAAYRDRPKMLKQLEKMIAEYVAEVRSTRGTIGSGAWIVGCGSLTNVRIGSAARISGALKLTDGTIHSSAEAPTKIGDGVIAEHFIVSTGAVVDSGAMVTHCFIGQGAKIGRHFSADHSLFFANCEALHGEACSAFAGPYTVTHHKSSLLIAGMFSFFNAGSGTNQSNHMYRLGPLHQGVLERGCKTGSDAYLLWPSRVGAFTTVIGRHKRRIDTTDFPFSYLVERDGRSVLIPGANLHSVGMRRDMAKWPQRDRRGSPAGSFDRLDLIHFDALNPCTVGKMIQGRQRMRALEAPDATTEYVELSGVAVARSRLRKGINGYTMAIDWYLGRNIADRLKSLARTMEPMQWVAALLKDPPDSEQCTQQLVSGGESRSAVGEGEWTDVCGWLAPAAIINEITNHIAEGFFHDLSELETALTRAHGSYAAWQWNWVLAMWLRELGKAATDVTLHDLADAVRSWKKTAEQWSKWVLRDAEQEFRPSSRIGYGLSGEDGAAEADFAAVRGSFDEQEFVALLKQERTETAAQADDLLQKIGEASPSCHCAGPA